MTGYRGVSDYDLVSYFDDELDPERREEVDALIARDPSAATRIEAWRRNDELLRIALGRVASEPLPALLTLTHRPSHSDAANSGDAPIRAPIRQVRRVERVRRERREKTVALTVASFAAGAIATLAAAGFTELAPRMLATPASYVFPSLVADAEGERVANRAMEAFWTFGAEDGRHRPDANSEADIASWLTRRVGAPVHAPALSLLGLRLIGGRLTPGDHGPAALILYRTPAGNSIALYVGRASSEDRSFHYSEQHVTGAIWWMERGASYAVVGRADRIGLLKIARLVRAAEPGRRHFQFTASAPT